MELLTDLLSAMYEGDQYHKDKEPMDTLRDKLGIGGPRPQKMNEENGTTLNKDEQEAMLSEN